MSVLRRAKLRTPDGTESIEYPLGVDAENVEVANRENLSQRLARIDEDLEKNEEDIAVVSELAGANKQNIGANEIRIDALERRSASVDKKPYYFDTVADMKAYQGLKAGDMAVTLGYYNVNDGGGAKYILVNDTKLEDDSGSIYTLDNGLKAKLILNDNGKLNIKKIGAYGDNIHDDTLVFEKAIEICKDNQINTLYIPKGIYKISNNLLIDYPLNIEGDYCEFTGDYNNENLGTLLIDNYNGNEPFIRYSDDVSSYPNSRLWGIKINDIQINGNNNNHIGLYLKQTG